MRTKRLPRFDVLSFSLLGLGSSYAQEATPERQEQSFSGITGQYDEEQLRRDPQVYEEGCRAYHGMKHLISRISIRPGGLELTVEEARSITSGCQLPAIQDDGRVGERDGTLNDSSISPYLNDREARYLSSGAEPIDLSYIACVHSHGRGLPQFLLDAFLPYMDQGADYVYALLIGYLPADPGLKASRRLPGGATNMPEPLANGEIQQSPASKKAEIEEQYARDATAFLAWTADPTISERKQQGNYVMGYLAITLGLLWIARLMERRSLMQIL